MNFEKWIEFQPAFDKRSADPSKNCGIHGVTICWYLRGEKGVIQFIIYSSWHLPHVQKELDSKIMPTGYEHLHCKPSPADFGYHAYEPQYDSQEPIQNSCPLLHDKPCYYDGSALYAIKVFNILVAEGHEAVWKLMEESYNERFNKQ